MGYLGEQRFQWSLARLRNGPSPDWAYWNKPRLPKPALLCQLFFICSIFLLPSIVIAEPDYYFENDKLVGSGSTCEPTRRGPFSSLAEALAAAKDHLECKSNIFTHSGFLGLYYDGYIWAESLPSPQGYIGPYDIYRYYPGPSFSLPPDGYYDSYPYIENTPIAACQAFINSQPAFAGYTANLYFDQYGSLVCEGVSGTDTVFLGNVKPYCPDFYYGRWNSTESATCWMENSPGEDNYDFIKIAVLNVSPEENNGDESCEKTAGTNPINLTVGNKYQHETDYIGAGESPIIFSRSYNSTSVEAAEALIGKNWTHDYSRRIHVSKPFSTSTERYASVFRGDGSAALFDFLNGNWVPRNAHSNTGELIENPDGTFNYQTIDDQLEVYASNGLLLTVTDSNGRTQSLTYGANNLLTRVANSIGDFIDFAYDTEGRISTVTNRASQVWTYLYDSNDNLEYVENPDGTTKQYHYENSSYPHALTGITDERGIRFATFSYDSQGRANMSAHANNAERKDITYNDDNTRTVINSLGVESTYTTLESQGIALVSQIVGPGCATCGVSNTSYNYDNANNLTSKTDNGVTTQYGNYDANGNPRFMIEAVGTAQERRTDYTYDSRFYSKVKRITEPSVWSGSSKVTTNTYDTNGNLLSTTITGYTPIGLAVSRITSFQYTGPLNQLSQIDGPRTAVSDITSFTYYPNNATEGNNRARLQSVTSGGLTLRDTIQYTATGKVQSETRPNGLTLSYTYYPGNDRLETLTETAGGVSNTTRWTYLATGEVESITTAHGSPDATTLSFGYDDARRLIRITDGLGNTIQYTLDTEGNQTGEDIFDTNDVLRKSLSRTFDVYNRLDVTTQANETLNSDFAPNGTLDKQTDGKGVITDYSYDNLKRLISVTQDLGGTDTSTQNALTQYGYDMQDNLTAVTDPNNGTTSYVYDDLGNLLSQTSPDIGITTFIHDSAGNVTGQTDAKGQVFGYSYDALNRLTQLDAPGTAVDITYSYDTCTNGTGRLCSITTSTTTVTYEYDGFGNVTSHQGIGYSYDAANRIESITYLSGAVVTYNYDAAGQVSTVKLTQGGNTTTLASAISYAPFGPVETLTYGNGLQVTQTLDNAYRLTDQSMAGVLDINYSLYDANGNLQNRSIDGLTDSFTYDALNRLNAATGRFGIRDYGYDKNGNRLSLDNGTLTTYNYAPNSNRLDNINTGAVILDANGNTTAKGSWTYTYTSLNRLKEAGLNGSLRGGSYDYNGLGQRVGKDASTPTGTLAGDADGNGLIEQADFDLVVQQILGNSTAPGTPDCNSDTSINVQDLACINLVMGNSAAVTSDISSFTYGLNGELLAESGATTKEYIYLNGAPLAVIDNTTVYYIHTDHLATPYKLTDSAGVVVWSASYDPFGKATVNEDPDNDGTHVTFSLRFPGQYADAETGLHYNYFRYYDPSTGRYVTSDPIGLNGGLNTFGYVAENPINFIDPIGLDATDWFNTSGGRSILNGPTNGNWGGRCWSGGHYSCGGNQSGNAPPTDSGDECYQRHDNCYVSCGNNSQCISACDQTLVNELEALPDDPRAWPNPPRFSTERDSRRYRDSAIWYFR